MKICFVTRIVPWPLSYGMRHRQYHILSALSSMGAVDLAVFSSHARETIPDEIQTLCRHVWQETPREPENATLEKTVVNAYEWLRKLYHWPVKTTSTYSVNRHYRARETLGREIYDLVWVERIGSVPYSRMVKGEHRVLDLDDIEHIKLKRKSETQSSSLKKIKTQTHALRMQGLEYRMMREFDRVVVCSEKDRAYLGMENAITIENGVDIDPDVEYTDGEPGHMLFLGLMEYIANDDAMLFFVRDILPKIRRGFPEANLTIVGRAPSAELSRMAQQVEGVCLTGFVREVASYMEKAALFVAPLRIGGGTRIKILEAMGAKVPVVSTSIGAEGLQLTDNKDISIADEAQEFADACIALLRDKRRRKTMALSGFDRVCAQYTSEAIADRVRSQTSELCRPSATQD